MGNRLTKIYTRTGDDGSTALANGKRVNKADFTFMVLGDVDELNAHIGMISAYVSTLYNSIEKDTNHIKENNSLANTSNQISELSNTLSIIQHLLFNIGGELAMPEYQGIGKNHIEWLEQDIDRLNSHLKPLKDFILPAGSVLVSQIHIARTVCRRAERGAVQLKSNKPNSMSLNILKLLNRLSDWLFVLARYCAKIEHSNEVLWNKSILEKLT